VSGSLPLYWRLLRLHHVRPNGWQRAVLVEGVLLVAVVLTLADVATAWTLLLLPLASMAVVKAHDVLAAMLSTGGTRPEPLPPPALDDYLPVIAAVAVFVVLRLAVHGTAGRILVAAACVLGLGVARRLRFTGGHLRVRRTESRPEV
jgi:hypothetical protein